MAYIWRFEVNTKLYCAYTSVILFWHTCKWLQHGHKICRDNLRTRHARIGKSASFYLLVSYCTDWRRCFSDYSIDDAQRWQFFWNDCYDVSVLTIVDTYSFSYPNIQWFLKRRYVVDLSVREKKNRRLGQVSINYFASRTLFLQKI